MTIKDVLKNTPARITLNDKWLGMNNDCFVVYYRKYYGRQSIVLYEGENEEQAIKYLTEGYGI
jgi:hypothetical protein